MRRRRIKTAPEERQEVYHCVSRTVNGERLLTAVDRELFRKQLWQIADFCGVQVLTYAILSNHFHILVRVPQKAHICDEELLRRYEVMYPHPTRHQATRLSVIKAQLAANGEEAIRWRTRHLRLMGDVSNYLKLLKQRFSIAFNKRHKRFGTLWAERFKSTVVQPGPALRAIAAYIDLNPVRAGMTDDPKDYRFCGYAEAIAGSPDARKGISWILSEVWDNAASRYRIELFGIGAYPTKKRRRISERAFKQVINEGGQLPISALLLCRIRYFTDAGILGSRAFVEEVARKCDLRIRSNLPKLDFAQELTEIHAARISRSPAIG